jgi:hypothetical protein
MDWCGAQIFNNGDCPFMFDQGNLEFREGCSVEFEANELDALTWWRALLWVTEKAQTTGYVHEKVSGGV